MEGIGGSIVLEEDMGWGSGDEAADVDGDRLEGEPADEVMSGGGDG